VAGWDRSRQATRVFRLSRIDGPVAMAGPPGSVTVPADADVRELVRNWDVTPRDRTAVLRVRSNAGHGLRRHARAVEPDAAEGWDRVIVQFADVPWYAEYVAWFGPDVIVLDPPDLRDAVKARLKGVLA
jgi:proteasome accessory factor B